MLQIILCDDDQFILQLAAEQITGLIKQYSLDAKIACIARESMQVIQYARNNEEDYLVFLDLDFGEGKLNGIDVAKQLKKMRDTVKIVFVTNHHEMAMKVLESGVEPFGFLEKTTDMAELTNGYQRYIRMALAAFVPREEAGEAIVLTVGIDEKITILKKQILYVETEKMVSHGISYHTVDGSYITVRDTIEHVLEVLGSDFLRVHRSIIVNKRQITHMKGSVIILSNGEEIPCAVRMRNEVKKWIH